MKSRYPVSRIHAVLILVLYLSACGTDTETLSSSNSGPLYAPDAVGPLAVGRSTFTIVDADRGDRELPVDVWYPVDPEHAAGVYTVYEVFGLTTPSELALDGAPMSRARRFPLVVFSHGSGGLRYQSFFLTEILASHGFVVVAPDHMGNTLFDELGRTFAPLTEMMVARPLDVSLLITRVLEKNQEPGDLLYRSIDPDRIGVCGHSFGGFTSLAAAAGVGAELPEGFTPVPPDPRVDAIAPIAPASWFGDEELAAISVPTLIVGGTKDETTPIAPNSVRPFALIPGPVYRADLEGAVHFSFSNSCDLIQGLIDRRFPVWFIDRLLGEEFREPCGGDVLNIDEAHRITNLYVVSLFKAFLKSDARYERFLTEAYALESEPDVTFFAKDD